MVISRLAELINLSFSLKDNVIIDALHMFEHRLNEIETSCGTLSLQFDQAKQPIRNIPKDENNRQLNVIARGIFIVPDLVNLWKLQIGYYEICNDVNSRSAELINISFSSKDNVIIDGLHMFEHRLDEIGDILWDAFLAIRSGDNVYYSLAHLSLNARAAEITTLGYYVITITATNTKKQLNDFTKIFLDKNLTTKIALHATQE
ncbi:hypothetical protein RhiirC2_779365 [Rhizophagus irregularis]|uniref:Uncharacterized protein n=1 Tax=Rhizophagus irregularis TaxID=588596 RepID=A0A2N1NA60_9GLOM|nr:hypothetical protein RhiirC2_779365 [Rhizophagus irregularis]